MRDLIQRPQRGAPPKGGWLSLDVQHGCAGDMLIGALLGLGLDEKLIADGLVNAHLPYIGVRVLTERRGPVSGEHVTFVDEAGRPLEGGPERTEMPRGTQRPRGERRHPVLQRDVRDVRASVSVTRFADTADIETTADGQESVPATTLERRDAVRRWLDDEMVSAASLTAHLRDNELGPQASMLAQRCLRRILATRAGAVAEVRPQNPDLATPEALAALMLPGRAALDLLCDAVGVAVLIEALSPVGIDASPVPFSRAPVRLDGARVPGPCPWASAALGAHPAFLMDDIDYPPTTPTGAAWISVLAQGRAPERMVNAHSGTGVGTLHVKAHANVCRARYGPVFHPGAVEAASGARVQFRVVARFSSPASAQGGAPLKAPHGVEDFVIDEANVCGTIGNVDHDGFVEALKAAGAMSIETSRVMRWTAALRPQSVTVRLGNRSAVVGVVERIGDDGVVTDAQVVPESVATAAARLGIPASRCALMALDVYDVICQADAKDAPDDSVRALDDPDGRS